MATSKTWKGELNQNQITFCQYYVSEEFFCNGTKAYIKAYPNIKEDWARRAASLLLTNIDILTYIDSILEDMGLNNQRVDKELAKLILQDDDRWIKLWWIKEYNKLKKRITDKLEVSWSLSLVDLHKSSKK